MKISVAMCTYNGSAFLDQQLACIASQTIPPDELVVSDDGSTDSTMDILRDFAATSSFPVVIKQNTTNLGFAQNFASCFAQCSGDIIVVTDQDDIWFPDRIERTQNAFAADPALGYVYSDAPFIDEFGQPTGVTLYGNYPVFSTDRAAFAEGRSILRAVLRWPLIYGTTMAFRACHLPSILPIPSGWSHDTWISSVLSSVAPSKKLAPVTQYRQHASQVVGGRDWNLSDHIQGAKERLSDTYVRDEVMLSQAVGILEAKSPGLPVLRKELTHKRDFFRKRNVVHQGGIRGFRALSSLLFSSDYWTFGAGLKTFVKDALLCAGVMK